MGKNKDKKEKNDKVKEVAAGTADQPIDYTKEAGPTAWFYMQQKLESAELADEFFFLHHAGMSTGKVIERGGVKQVTWKHNNKRVATSTLNNILCGTELPPVKKAEPKSKALLLNNEQLDKKYKIKQLAESLQMAQYGKKKQRSQLLDSFSGKKATGLDISAKIEKVFGAIPDHDMFSIFERMDNQK